MRILLAAGLCCMLTAGVFGQHRGGGGFHTGGGGFRGGRTGGGIGRMGGGYARGSFHYGGMRSGYYGSRGFSHRYGYWGSFYSPYSYGYPFYYNSWWPSYGYGYYDIAPAYAYGQSPNVTVVYPETPATSSVVVVPSYPAAPSPAPREPARSGEQTDNRGESPLYLIAFRDHLIRPAVAYWVDGSTLHYVDMDHKMKQVSLDTVDRDFSRRLNEERRVPFRLPE